MGIKHGKDGTVKLTDNVVASVISWSASINLGTADGASMGDQWDNPIAGRGNWSGSINLHLNLENTHQKTLHDVLVTASPTGALATLRLFEDATHYYFGSVLITGVNPSVSKDDTNKLSVNFTGVGAPSYT